MIFIKQKKTSTLSIQSAPFFINNELFLSFTFDQFKPVARQIQVGHSMGIRRAKKQ